MDLLLRLLDQLCHHDIQALEFSGGGEPLAHPQITDVLYSACRMGFEIGLITCGNFLNRRPIAEAIVNCCRWCRVALDAATHETYSKIHGNNLSFTELCAAVDDLVNRRSKFKKEMLIGVKFLVSRLNGHECYRGAQLAARLGVDYIQYGAVRNCPSLEIASPQVEEITQAINQARAELQSDTFAVAGGVKRSLVDRPCVLTPLHSVIDTDGEIYICPFFEHRLHSHRIGSICQSDFFTLWGSENHQRAIKKINVNECRVYDCPAVAYHPFMDTYIRNDPLCVRFT